MEGVAGLECAGKVAMDGAGGLGGVLGGPPWAHPLPPCAPVVTGAPCANGSDGAEVGVHRAETGAAARK